MSVSDPIADVITIIRNANRARKATADVKASKLVEAILTLMKKEGFIANFKPLEYKNQGLFRVYFKYADEKTPAINNIKKISKPGLRKYTTKDEIPNVYGGLGVAVISTSKGIMTNTEAKEANVGGEVLLYIW
jgi:small subunit ribosomal protein S8